MKVDIYNSQAVTSKSSAMSKEFLRCRFVLKLRQNLLRFSTKHTYSFRECSEALLKRKATNNEQNTKMETCCAKMKQNKQIIAAAINEDKKWRSVFIIFFPFFSLHVPLCICSTLEMDYFIGMKMESRNSIDSLFQQQ